VTELPPGLLRETAPPTARPLRGFDGERHGGPVDGVRPGASHDQRRHEARNEGSGYDHGRVGTGRHDYDPGHAYRGHGRELGKDHGRGGYDGTPSGEAAVPVPEPSALLIFMFALLTAAFPLGRMGRHGVELPTSVRSRDAMLAVFRAWPRAAKRGLDVLGAAIGLALLAPLLPFVALAIRLDSRGPVFFGQTRCGKDGRPFQMWKLRSMVQHAESLRSHLEDRNEMNGPVFKVESDPRVTRVGRWLRRLSLDETPQFWNVLCGEMSLVGPRPPLPCEVEEYGPRERRRLDVTPGITCTWQVSGRNEIGFDQWVDMDIEYIESWSLRSDHSHR
jgi:lipopolysaccharide/colanic/teichoic acid biosynthesis glycosyltransferase